MSDIAILKTHGGGRGLPKGVLFGALGLIGFTLAASGAARYTGVGRVHLPPSTAVETLQLRFEDENNGAVAVRDASDGKIIYTVAPETNGFIRATMRGLTRERVRSAEVPFALTHWSDGTMSLLDPTDGRRVSLEAFGPTNAQAFAQLFADRDQTR
jgi:putative photosynthetic complex assembly protein